MRNQLIITTLAIASFSISANAQNFQNLMGSVQLKLESARAAFPRASRELRHAPVVRLKTSYATLESGVKDMREAFIGLERLYSVLAGVPMESRSTDEYQSAVREFARLRDDLFAVRNSMNAAENEIRSDHDKTPDLNIHGKLLATGIKDSLSRIVPEINQYQPSRFGTALLSPPPAAPQPVLIPMTPVAPAPAQPVQQTAAPASRFGEPTHPMTRAIFDDQAAEKSAIAAQTNPGSDREPNHRLEGSPSPSIGSSIARQVELLVDKAIEEERVKLRREFEEQIQKTAKERDDAVANLRATEDQLKLKTEECDGLKIQLKASNDLAAARKTLIQTQTEEIALLRKELEETMVALRELEKLAEGRQSSIGKTLGTTSISSPVATAQK